MRALTVEVHNALPIRVRLDHLKRRTLWTLAGASSTVDGSRIALTYDDGPHPEHTPQILDALRSAGVRATFFVLGDEAVAHPDLVRRMITEGHRVGAHGMSHVDLRTLDVRAARREVEQSIAVISEVAGTAVTLFRPPFRGVDLRTALMLRRTDLRVEMANCDSYDWKPSATAEAIVARVQAAAPGSVVLLHDTVVHTVEATERLVAEPERFLHR